MIFVHIHNFTVFNSMRSITYSIKNILQVVLPTFILERRSLLEMFADCMAHPDVFLK